MHLGKDSFGVNEKKITASFGDGDENNGVLNLWLAISAVPLLEPVEGHS